MGEAEAKNNKQPGEQEPPPTASFSDSVIGPGSKIGPFRIEQELGRGGMGVVYLAHDTRLDRSVALKSLPDEVMANPKARSRFSREARVLASLNHPNIATIHDEVEKTEGATYLVLEYVPGQTLAERIAGAKLKPREALTIALQIAEAVAAAHEHDVIHRDLKPGNVKITPEGRVKVLDFGLAKAVGGEALDEQTTVTEPGRVIGTPAYMSPEQARGRPTDKRSDIWSFGCVLYEMLTGKLPFEGETVSDTLANILQTEPNWQVLPKGTPANICVLLRRCLEKESSRRLQHIGDAAIEIQETLHPPDFAPPVRIDMQIHSKSMLKKYGAIFGLAGFVVGLISVFIVNQLISTPSSPEGTRPVQRMLINLPENQTLALSQSTPLGIARPAVTLSGDGSRLVYVADVDDTTQLFLRRMDQMEVKQIPGTQGAFAPFFAPDSRTVGFFTKDKLKTVSLLGGEPAILCDARITTGGTWSSDDTIYFSQDEGSQLLRVPATGGTPELIRALVEPPEQGAFSYGYPMLLPDEKHLLLSSRTSTLMFSLETRKKKILVKDGPYGRYVPTGHLLYVRAGAIEAAPFSLKTLQVTGPSIPVLDNVLMDSRHGTAQFAYSAQGLLVYVSGDDTAKSIPASVNRNGNAELLPMPVQTYGTFKLSPNGQQLAIEVAGPPSDVYLYDIIRGSGTRFTLKGNNFRPIWTPDGRWITFGSDRQGQEHINLFWKPADGSHDAERLYSAQVNANAYSWLIENGSRSLVFTQNSPDMKNDIWIFSTDGQHESKPILATQFNEWGPAFSPNGQWIAYTSDKDGKYQVYVQSYPEMDRIWKISDDFGEEPIWSPIGDELFYRNGDKWMVVSISTEPNFVAGTPQVLFEGPYLNVPGISYDVAPDAQRFLVLKPQYDDSQVRELHVVLNWFEELKRLVPTGKNQ